MKESKKEHFPVHGADLIIQGAQGLLALAEAFPSGFPHALEALKALPGKLICVGVGKSGHVARKAAATFSSTGQPAFFIHPTEALHGDLGAWQKGDGAFLFSNSGQTPEILSVLSLLKKKHVIFGMTQDSDSPLAQLSDHVLILPRSREMCPLGVAPSTSVLMMMALSDALAFCLSHKRGLTYEQYHGCHPGGMLGYKLLRVDQVMQKPVPLAAFDAPISVLVQKLAQDRLGCLGLVDDQGNLKTILQAQDLLAFFDHGVASLDQTPPPGIERHWRVEQALDFCEEKNLEWVFVLDDHKKPVGLFDRKRFLRSCF